MHRIITEEPFHGAARAGSAPPAQRIPPQPHHSRQRKAAGRGENQSDSTIEHDIFNQGTKGVTLTCSFLASVTLHNDM